MTTYRLILTRHAKSSWDAPVGDHDRPLNKRGRRAAPAVGRWLAAQGYVPDIVLCSTALRATETWERLRPHLLAGPEVVFRGALYHASPVAMMFAVAERAETTVMLIGHNPGIADLAQGLVARPPAHHDFDRYPTAATAVIDLEGRNWAEALRTPGHLTGFAVPGDLM